MLSRMAFMTVLEAVGAVEGQGWEPYLPNCGYGANWQGKVLISCNRNAWYLEIYDGDDTVEHGPFRSAHAAAQLAWKVGGDAFREANPSLAPG